MSGGILELSRSTCTTCANGGGRRVLGCPRQLRVSQVRRIGNESRVASPINSAAPGRSYGPKGSSEQADAVFVAPQSASATEAAHLTPAMKCERDLRRPLSIDQRDGESVVPLTPDSLKSCCGYARLQRQVIVETPNTLHARILAVGVNHRTFPDDVI